MSRIAVLTVAVIGGVALGFALAKLVTGGRPLVPPNNRPETTITLRLVNDTCKPSDPRLLAQKNTQNVTWRIRNECGRPFDVELRNFKEKMDDDSFGPIQTVTDPAVPKGTIGTGGGNITARLARTDAPPEGGALYKYEIWLAPRGEPVVLGRDPDLEIWP